MLIHFGADLIEPEWSGSVVCIGTFDGVHIGHQQVIKEAMSQAKARELPCVVVTFDRHPAHVLAPDKAPRSVQTLDQKLESLKALQVPVTVILPFDRQLCNTTADQFLKAILFEKLKAKLVVVGHDFAMGSGRQGTPEWLGSRIETIVVPAFEIDGTRVSSSAVRQAVTDGEPQMAAKLLGRSYTLIGNVVSGQKLGRELGFPTLNLARSSVGIEPRRGVYAGRARTPYGEFLAAISIGIRPTVDGSYQTIEAYLLDYPGQSLYGATVELELTHYLRPEEKYDSLAKLIDQIKLDVEQTRHLLTS